MFVTKSMNVQTKRLPVSTGETEQSSKSSGVNAEPLLPKMAAATRLYTKGPYTQQESFCILNRKHFIYIPYAHET